MKENNTLYNLTLELLKIVRSAEEEYDNRRETDLKGDFWKEVKPFADNAHSLSKDWGEAAAAFLHKQPQKNLHPNQIKATVENVELLTVQCFFPATSYNRFKSYIQSSFYVIEQVRVILEE
ncbi:DUF1798 family protein [Jeotgalibacillus campisalis]|uniref:DUF1798 family protein n=1 Tax=Jeotgalibacillus campisalis TaxID=220754 RepID=A0A0C2VVN1_9BACL|nr:DUF1798 family protein [Jeotgalibacillus campisalis]KIL48023.1 hypothetical protein KR50_21900 [Jeotgalibacillus campisalis]